MRPSIESVAAACKGVGRLFIEDHLSRLDDPYFAAFDLADIAAHIKAVSALGPGHPVEVLISRRSPDSVECTVIAFDYPAEFSLITGVLTGMGFGIESGDVFTYAPAGDGPPARATPRRFRRQAADTRAATLRRRKIVDRFTGTIAASGSYEAWRDDLRRRLAEVVGLLEEGSADGVSRAKNSVNERVASRLSVNPSATLPLLYPMQIEIENGSSPHTVLHIVSQDTPAFLYSLSSALALRGISIEHVRIRTSQGRIEDEIGVLDAEGRRIEDPEALNRIKLAVLLTKQFTYFLTQAPDPYTALCRFEHLLDDILRMPERGRWLDFLSQPKALQDLARILGASDTIWEDMVRLQYESLLPMLQPHIEGRALSLSREEALLRLRAALAGAKGIEEKKAVLNDFKDRELFRIDLDNILNTRRTVRELAEPLTALAELVVEAAARILFDTLAERHGRPRTVGGLEARHALFGLGKFGGVALGYASDIELLLVYSDNGVTDGAQPVENAEFFGQLVRGIADFIAAKREGIFHVDLRLRPYSASGQWACSLESFCRYYGTGGPAHAYERLALVRLRNVGGDRELGQQIERIREEFVYESRSIHFKQLRELRERQLAEKVKPGQYNAKFSPGALVDLEYDVQILQAIHGAADRRLRTPRIHEALEALADAGIMGRDESRQLAEAYYFLRRLINGLRMLRGSALDLFLPPAGSLEYAHLARRMGYQRGEELAPEETLHLDFETHTAVVRAFVERHFGRESLPGPAEGNVVDLILSAAPDAALRDKVLARVGFANTERALANLRRLAGQGGQQELFIKLAVLACDTLRRVPDPDMALNNWERLASELPDIMDHYRRLFSQPQRISLLMAILAGSQFLADTLIRYPDFFDWATDSRNLKAPKGRPELQADLAAFAGEDLAHGDWLNAVRRFRRRELLRIGTRDICLHVPLEEVTSDISCLAETVIGAVLRRRALLGGQRAGAGGGEAALGHLCIMGMGKLGGHELNYSSDVDLVGLCDDEAAKSPDLMESLQILVRRANHDLSSHTEEGSAYRVDFRLRPHGRAGQVVQPMQALLRYYREDAAMWEVQALLKMRPVAGALEIGERFLREVRPVLLAQRPREAVVQSIVSMRHKAIQHMAAEIAGVVDIKSGLGGIRDVEFLVQGLQLIHAAEHPETIEGNTVSALRCLKTAGLLDESVADELAGDYVFLRRIEHCLQILEDQQIHSLPRDPVHLGALARRVMGIEAGSESFRKELHACQTRIRATYLRHFSA